MLAWILLVQRFLRRAVNQLRAAPFYLFDAMDTLDKIKRPSPMPLTRAAVRAKAATHELIEAALRAL